MGIALVRLPAHKLNLSIFTGAVGREGLLSFHRGLDERDPDNAAPLVTYMAPDVDLSRIDLIAFAELKQILAPKLRVLAETPGFCCIIVCNSEQCETITRFWRAYLARDRTYPSLPIFFPELEQACRWLKLPPSAYEAASEAIRALEAEPDERPEPA